jgi:hypothetical protein
MSSRNFKNLSRAFNRGHIAVIPNGKGGVSLFRKVKSDKVGAGDHRRWPKELNLFHGDQSVPARVKPQKWAPY